ncbi:hypothetical protein [Sorangium sp. So ce406]|uniref:hypothetical protein n=1 Tax=Sorangium sp. So ce406 TaxID=3133311 RepID=UPI003F5B526E
MVVVDQVRELVGEHVVDKGSTTTCRVAIVPSLVVRTVEEVCSCTEPAPYAIARTRMDLEGHAGSIDPALNEAAGAPGA